MATKKKPIASKKTSKNKDSHLVNFRKEMFRQMLKLSTSGFGLVAALAWNELIKALVADYIKPYVGGASGVISLLIYALIVTVLAVFVTYNLSLLTKKDK